MDIAVPPPQRPRSLYVRILFQAKSGSYHDVLGTPTNGTPNATTRRFYWPAERLCAEPGGSHSAGGNQSRARGRHPEKIERDVEYASFLHWEKSWNISVIRAT